MELSLKSLIVKSAKGLGLPKGALNSNYKLALMGNDPAASFIALMSEYSTDIPKLYSLFYLVDCYKKQEPLWEFKTLEPTHAHTHTHTQLNFTWSPQQNEAFNLIFKWLRTRNRPQVFKLFGWAGTGKTSMMHHVVDFINQEAGKRGVPRGHVQFAAFTGKAVSVLKSKGCAEAATIHSLIYKPQIDPVTGKCKSFVPNYESPLSTASLLILDEVSMVNEEIALDILAFGKPVLVLGDPFQLPPVKGEGYFMDTPNFMLTDVRRQAKDNPIIHLATRVREGRSLKAGKYGESIVLDENAYRDPAYYATHDQILVGLNATRSSMNKKARLLNGKAHINPVMPVKGDRLICLKNQKDLGFYNGGLFLAGDPEDTSIMVLKSKTSKEYRDTKVPGVFMHLESLDDVDASGDRIIIPSVFSKHWFDKSLPEPHWKDLVGTQELDFAYAVTVHKYQGSQADSVLVIDESSVFREHASRHLYTAITRAAKRLTLLR